MDVQAQTVLCPHCRKEFEPDLIAANTERAGFKCPHCRLFVARDRAEEPETASAG